MSSVEFVDTVSQALDHEKAAQRMAGWWFQTLEMRHQMLQHWKQAMMIWELAGFFPEQAERCRQMMLLHDGEGDCEGDEKEAVPDNTTEDARARYLAQYEYFIREAQKWQQQHPRKRRRRNNTETEPETKENGGVDTSYHNPHQTHIYDFYPPAPHHQETEQKEIGAAAGVFVGLSLPS